MIITNERDMMISKELLSEVLGVGTIQMNPIYEKSNMVGYLVYGSQNTPTEVRHNHKQINIYELAHKCKEWSAQQGYIITSEVNTYASYSYIKLDVLKGSFQEEFEEVTEPEAIFKACQWILDNKDKR